MGADAVGPMSVEPRPNEIDRSGRASRSPAGRPWLTLANVTVRLRDRWYLKHTNWQIRDDERWAIVGPNGSGKTTLARTLLGQVPVVAGRVIRHYAAGRPTHAERVPMAYVAPEQTRQLVAQARWQERLIEFSAGSGRGTCREYRVRDLLLTAAISTGTGASSAARPLWLEELATQTGIGHLLETPVGALSSGEIARVLVARALSQRPHLLILDEPYNGLDAAARCDLERLISDRVAAGLKVVFITHRPVELLPAISHLALLDDGRITAQGRRDDIAPLWHSQRPGRRPAPRPVTLPTPRTPTETSATPLIAMRSVSVAYGAKRVLDDITWQMYPDQHWAIAGPNGAGKTTLLALISGDHLQAYSNEIHLFGRRRGSGESVWEIKRQIGLVTPHFHAGYQKKLTAFEVVCSGWFDTVGLYRHCSQAQRRSAFRQMQQMEIEPLADKAFEHLSHGQQRLVLIARALVKRPTLLVLDEPCAGLDRRHRQALLAQLDAIAARGTSQLLYVTHHQDERPACITHTLRLASGRIAEIRTHRL